MNFSEMFLQAMFVMTIISSLPLVASVVLGLLVSVLQAATQVQEQTLGFLVKLVAIGVVLFFFGPWLSNNLLEFTVYSLEQVRYAGVAA